jgi:peptide/nickel transport system permease protein
MARALELLDMVRIPEPRRVAGLYPHQISGGMAQRVAIAIALAGQPELLIADEPTTALDVTVQAEILQLLGDLRAQTGLALLLISHDWGVVAQICDRCVVMYAGEAVEYGPTTAIVSRPLHPYSEGLLAANPHSAVPGQPLASIPGTVPPPGSWPAGCHFQDRCRYAAAECAAPIPLAELGAGRLTRCIRSHLMSPGGESGQPTTPAGRA